MSTFKDILDTIKSMEGDVVDHIICGRRNQSLSKQSKEGIMNFPVLVSDTLSIEDASLVSKALEKEFASFTLVCMTMNPTLTVHNNASASAADYVNRFHQNIDVKAAPSDLLNTITSFSTEALNKFDIAYESVKGMEQFMLYHVYENVNYYKLNKENAKFSYTIEEVTESQILNDLYKRRITTLHPTLENGNNRGGRRNNGYRDNINRSFNTVNNITNNIPNDLDINTGMTIRIDEREIGRGIGSQLARGQVAAAGRDARQLNHMLDNDIKKANELVPTLLHMRIYPMDKDGNQAPPIDFVLGIKATLHPISSDEMVVNICRGIKNESTFFNFIRWTTGEIRFFKDFVFAMNELKLDAINSGEGASKWWSMLKRRKAIAKIKNVILPNKMLPNATIVVTQDEVNTIKDVYGYDLNNMSLVNKLMSNYFLIAFVIVDPALQRVKFLFDGSTQYETLTYATLARESSTNDKQFKEMLNMLGRRM